MAEKLSVVMARKHLEGADVALLIIDATEGVTARDATIAGYAHESGRSVVVVINKWDLVTDRRTDGKPPPIAQFTRSRSGGILSSCRTLPSFLCRRLRGKIWRSYSLLWSWSRASGANESAPER